MLKASLNIVSFSWVNLGRLVARPSLHSSACLAKEVPATASESRHLNAEEARSLKEALVKMQEPIKLASRIATLATLSVLYRDMALTADSIHSRMAGSLNPLVDETTTSTKLMNRQNTHSSYPLNDTSKLPDFEAPSGMHLEQKYMDKITAWHALQPNHIETSHQLLTGINLFPPQEASYPTYIDFDAVIKGLEQRKSRKRLKLFKKLRLKQDKYQLKVWDHYPGHQ